MAVVVATGITETGEREVLGLDIGDSEGEVFWTDFLNSLKARGLADVRLVISDQHSGLVAALRRTMQGVAHNAAESISPGTCLRMCPRNRPTTSLPRSGPSSPRPNPTP